MLYATHLLMCLGGTYDPAVVTFLGRVSCRIGMEREGRNRKQTFQKLKHKMRGFCSKLSRFFNSCMRQLRKVSVSPPKPEGVQVYMIHTLGIKAFTSSAGGTEKLSIFLSERKSFM